MKTEIEYKGITFEVDFEYQPEEKPEIGPDAQYAGMHEGIEINSITMIPEQGETEEIEGIILGEIKNKTITIV